MVMADMDTVVMATAMAMAILHNKKEDSFQDFSERNKIDHNKKALQRISRALKKSPIGLAKKRSGKQKFSTPFFVS